MPVEAQSQSGVARVSSGSLMTVLGWRRGSSVARLSLLASSVAPPPGVYSPAERVVGTAMWISAAPPAAVAPKALSRRSSPASSVMSRPCITEAAATLAVSIGLPPPKLTTASASSRSSSRVRSRTVWVGTC